LIKEIFITNRHRATVSVVPVDAPEISSEQVKLQELLQSCSSFDLEQIRAKEEKLREVQGAPDKPEDIAKLPHLNLEDLNEAPTEGEFFVENTNAGYSVLHHNIKTHGIDYFNLYFSLNGIDFSDVPYVSILASVLGKLDTQKHSALEIDTLSQLYLGNLGFACEVHENPKCPEDFQPKFYISSSALSQNSHYAADLISEVLTTTNFSDTSKILNILKQRKVRMEQGFSSNGHSLAMSRVSSYYSKPAVLRQWLSGIDFYYFLSNLIDDFDNIKLELSNRLNSIAKRLFTANNCLASISSSGTSPQDFLDKLELYPGSSDASVLVIPDPVSKKEAFVVPTDVSYTAVGLNIAECNNANSEMTYSGKWLVAGRVLSYDYLWQRVRVIGGAYGTGFSALRTGACRFYSYRDPHIDQTLEAFKEAGQWLSNFDTSDDEFEGYVVSTVSSFDSPLKPRELTKRQDSMFLSNYTQSERLKTRSQIVNTSIDDVRALGGAVSEIASSDYVCTVGSLELINSAQHDFNVVELLA
jgi:hypothetical protein